ncbi:type II secretion system minor pseudopilin GspI [Planctobacterium marinum]|uniref:type II secretion system minor pseudopilin GspI n=1 Tax=Planctobacterium marinum TaxID=1631968 RepID=UPI001E3A3231|nr:type II secretion system minor pseudopilin GspI [Planctobacterium marinum]MCC2606491.1 type II secretion system minor pseudopilin GspI [Planctobacterium marinum]
MNNKGLTLLEVMVALFIFALTATSIMKAASEHIRGISTLEDITMATWVANNELNKLVTERRWPPENNLKGNTELAGRTWYYQYLVSETQDKEFRQVEVVVAQDQQMESVITSVITYIANPSPAPVG